MQKDDDSLTFNPHNRSFTYTIVLVSYCLKVLSILYLISKYEHKMNKPKRTATLGSFIIEKLRNISKAFSNSNPNVDTHTETTDVNLNQHTINSHVNEMTIPLLSPKNDRSSIDNNDDGFMNSTLSNEEAPFFFSVNFRCSKSEHGDNNL